MKIATNQLQSVIYYFRNELTHLYPKNEINSMVFIVLEHYFNLTKNDIILNTPRLFSESELLLVINTVKQLKSHKPLAYILGEWYFYGLDLKINENVLIPRPETEELVQLILVENDSTNHFLDIGTGSGCIALVIKNSFKNARVAAWDISEKALEIAKYNAKKYNLDVDFNCVDILNMDCTLSEKFDVIVSNPPYVKKEESITMNKNVLNYEPHLALFVEDNNPFIFYEKIADFALKNLKNNGRIYFEINESFGDEIESLLDRKGFTSIRILNDMNGKNRIAKAVLI